VEFSVLAKRLAGKSVSDMTYLVLKGTLNLTGVTQLINKKCIHTSEWSKVMWTLPCNSNNKTGTAGLQHNICTVHNWRVNWPLETNIRVHCSYSTQQPVILEMFLTVNHLD